MAKTMVTRICENCGGEFQARPIDVAYGRAKTCSRSCLYQVKTKKTDRPHAIVSYREDGAVRVSRPGLYSTLIDTSDLDWFLDYDGGWCTTNHGYIQASHGYQRLHKLLQPCDPGYVVDHINRDTTDNRRSNLRSVTSKQNSHNCLQPNKRGFKGILFQHDTAKYGGVIKAPDGARRSIGAYKTPEAAARAHDILAHKWRGECAYLNFPNNLMTDEEIAQSPRISALLAYYNGE